ncbi:putative urease accessory protein [Erysiphe neolycopersici]|uniref:Putative urease accessory protein n=1 Tax=Erysiphe neolycopersici TaxID=212602 RepID=A0A420HTX9_9PEZI|nr:putative urease accessory protein [Erysiphe neolycopersici]
MLTWLLGGERSQAGHDVDESHEEVPETPAPTFVARAFKTALFGTPAPPGTPETDFKSKGKSQERLSLRLNSENIPSKKPPGILLTPGTATTLRKTVSFDKDVIEIEKCSISNIVAEAAHKTSGANLDSLGQKLSHNDRKTPLTRRFENVRKQSLENETINKYLGSKYENTNLNHSGKTANKALFESQVDHVGKINDGIDLSDAINNLNPENQDQDEEDEGDEGDATTDLNRPHSQSGKYWKSEFENYHKEARLEMRKLLSYKELAKSFAKIKDERSINLAEKLKEEQRKVIAMEETISRLSANIRFIDPEGVQIIDEPKILIKELARQTTRAVQYKEQVDEFRKLMEKIEPYNLKIEGEAKENDFLQAAENKTNAETEFLISQMKGEIIYLSEKLQDFLSLKEENEKLRKITHDKDRTIDLLKFEKEQLLRGTQQSEVKNDLKINFDEDMGIVNLNKQVKSVEENVTTKSHNQSIHSRNQIKTPRNLVEYPIDIQKSTELNDYEDHLISRHNENRIQLHRSSLDLEEQNKVNLKPVLQDSKILSETNSQENHLSNLGLLGSPRHHKTRVRIPASEPQSKSTNIQLFHENKAEVSKSPKTQDQSKTVPPYSENKNIINISPISSFSEKYKSTLSTQKPELSDNNFHTSKTHQDFYYRSSRRVSSTDLSPPKNSILIKKSDGDFKRSISCSSRLGNIGDRPTRSTLSAERVEAAKKRLAEKKKLSIAARRNPIN